jgi:hypothetical protein
MSNGKLHTLSWAEVWKSRRAKWAIAFCIIAILIDIFYLPFFYQHVLEPKAGTLIHDVILNAFTPRDWSVIIFSIIYLTILQTFLTNLRYPDILLLGLTSYLMVTLIRIITMYLFTLDPPADMILLVDPVTSRFYPDPGFAKDLFFSGHISTLTIMILLEHNKVIRIVKSSGLYWLLYYWPGSMSIIRWISWWLPLFQQAYTSWSVLS